MLTNEQAIAKYDDRTNKELLRIHDLIVANILKNHGKCTGFIESTILSDNVLVNSLVNIRRMDIPCEFEDQFDDITNDVELNWPSEPMIDGDNSANDIAYGLDIIGGWYDFYNYENKYKPNDRDLIRALDEIERDGVIACTEHNISVLNDLGLSKNTLDMFYHNGFKTLYDLPNFDDDILPDDENEWSEDDKAFYFKYEPLVESMTEQEFNKCCDLLNDETIPCLYGDAIEDVLGIKKDNAWKFDPFMNAMYGYGEEYKEDYMKELENKHNKLLQLTGSDDYLKAEWFLKENDLSINDIIDENGNYEKDKVDNYYKTHDEPNNDDWITYLSLVGSKASGIQDFLDSLNKSKDGKDREYSNYKKRTMGK